VSVIRDEVMKEIPDGRLRLFVVWEPILPKDGVDALDDSSAMVQDEWRALQFWDPNAESGKRIKKLFDLKIVNPAWDVYMLYPPGVKWGVKWDAETPAPAYWMHQLTFMPGGADERRYGGLRLDPKKLREEIQMRLTR
jgi:hypothetical protein